MSNLDNVFFKSKTALRDLEIAEKIKSGKPVPDIQKEYFFRKGRVLTAQRRGEATQIFDIKLTDGSTTVAVGKFGVMGDFVEACKFAYKTYLGLFESIELPIWNFTDTENQINVFEIRQLLPQKRK